MTEKKPTREKALPTQPQQSHRPVVRKQDNWGVSFALAVIVHCMLFVGLFVVFQWNRESDEVVYAELWAPSELPKGAPVTAPPLPEEKPAEQETEPEPQPEPAPEPEQKPEPQPEEPPQETEQQPPENAAPPLQEETRERVEQTPEDVIEQQDE